MKRRWVFVTILIVVLASVVIYSATRKEKSVMIKAVVASGKFDVIVSTTGELQALNSVDIRGPEGLRESRVHNVKLVDLIPEGSVVKAGDYIASLDKTEATTALQSMGDQIERDEASLRQTQLDTTMSLRDYRNQIKDLEYALEEKQIILDQSKFEPPATIRQSEMNLDKAKRAYEQAKTNYGLRKEQSEAAMTKSEINLKRQYQQRNELNKVLDAFTVYAPRDGMVIYKKEWGGAKRKVGSQISAWDPVVATLPDLSKMISKTYVNEIDISKISTGQEVTIGVDAFPEKQYTGKVTEVANVGEQLPNSDAKVFEVIVLLNESDTTLRPAMTTVTQIRTNTYDNVKFIPLEAVHSTDSMSYVYLTVAKVRQIIDLMEANENFIIVNAGLEAGNEVFLTVPEGGDKWEIKGWDIYEKVKQRRILEEKKKKEDMERMQKEQAERAKLMEEKGGVQGMPKFDMKNMTKEQREQMQKMMNQGGAGGMRMQTQR
ncbi:MAG: HlyD family efflux transporter periplasmic adaptor subunit [Porphyromonadaceae bacterium]|nr:MAG: HlyD family efflux transporter periplasmic adaptor subunit [Porphyromonadaceae bacterium]